MSIDKSEDVTKILKRVARNIRDTRQSLHLTQNEMNEFGFGARWYQRLESGKHVPTIPTLCKLATAFKVDISEFFK